MVGLGGGKQRVEGEVRRAPAGKAFMQVTSEQVVIV